MREGHGTEMVSPHHPAQPLVAKLERVFPLTDDGQASVLNLSMQVQDLSADQDIVREDVAPSDPSCCWRV